MRQIRVTRCDPVVFSLRQISSSPWGSSAAGAGGALVLATVGTETTCSSPSDDCAVALEAVPLATAGVLATVGVLVAVLALL